MRKGLIIMIVSLLFLILAQFAYFPAHDDEVSYKHYREEYAHNLKNPLLERYRKLSSEGSREVLPEGNEKKETQ